MNTLVRSNLEPSPVCSLLSNIQFTHDDQYLVSNDSTDTIFVWNAETGAEERKLSICQEAFVNVPQPVMVHDSENIIAFNYFFGCGVLDIMSMQIIMKVPKVGGTNYKEYDYVIDIWDIVTKEKVLTVDTTYYFER